MQIHLLLHAKNTFARFHLETSILGSYDKLPLIWLLKFESQFPTLICKEREGGKEEPDRHSPHWARAGRRLGMSANRWQRQALAFAIKSCLQKSYQLPVPRRKIRSKHLAIRVFTNVCKVHALII